MPVVTKKMPYVISGMIIPGTLATVSETGASTWTALGNTTPTFVVNDNTGFRWTEHTPGESIEELVRLVPSIGQPPVEAAKYRERSGSRISRNVTQDLKETIFIDLATNG